MACEGTGTPGLGSQGAECWASMATIPTVTHSFPPRLVGWAWHSSALCLVSGTATKHRSAGPAFQPDRAAGLGLVLLCQPRGGIQETLLVPSMNCPLQPRQPGLLSRSWDAAHEPGLCIADTAAAVLPRGRPWTTGEQLGGCQCSVLESSQEVKDELGQEEQLHPPGLEGARVPSSSQKGASLNRSSGPTRLRGCKACLVPPSRPAGTTPGSGQEAAWV